MPDPWTCGACGTGYVVPSLARDCCTPAPSNQHPTPRRDKRHPHSRARTTRTDRPLDELNARDSQ